MTGSSLRQGVVLGTALALLLLATAALGQPRLVRDGQRLLLADLPPILEEESVASQLTSGLTTSFGFRLDLPRAHGGRGAGGARVDLRYDLWDEQYLLTVVGTDGSSKRHVVDSLDELTSWWKEIQLIVLAGSGPGSRAPGSRVPGDSAQSGGVPSGVQARLVLEVVPFSRSEQLDAQRWLTDSAVREQAATPGGGGSGDRVLSLLIATSVQRRPLVSYRFNLTTP